MLSDEYFELFQDRYSSYNISLPEELPFSPNHEIFDIGCGHGIETEELVKRGYSVTAIEPDPTARICALTRLVSSHGTHCPVTLLPYSISEVIFPEKIGGILLKNVLTFLDVEERKLVWNAAVNLVPGAGILILRAWNKNMQPIPPRLTFKEPINFGRITYRRWHERVLKGSDLLIRNGVDLISGGKIIFTEIKEHIRIYLTEEMVLAELPKNLSAVELDKNWLVIKAS